MKTRVMIVDDQFMARQLFQLYLKDNQKYEVVAMLDSAEKACDYVAYKPIDIIIMDIMMYDGSNGLIAAKRIKQCHPRVKIIAVTSMPETSWLNKAKQIGIESFWYKESSKTTILDVIDRTIAGESVYPNHAPSIEVGLAKSTEFTERELQVLRVMTTGATNSEIAEILKISNGTVKNHVHNMLEKTGFASRTELAIEARISGMTIYIEE